MPWHDKVSQGMNQHGGNYGGGDKEAKDPMGESGIGGGCREGGGTKCMAIGSSPLLDGEA